MSEQEELFPQFPPLPALAFRDGTSSGFSGTDTSEQRAKLRDLTGATSEVQRAITNSLKLSRLRGRTVGELDEEIYVMPYNTAERITEVQGRKR